MHDETQWECADKDVDKLKSLLVQASLTAGESLGFRLPVESEAKSGKSWADTH